ncbi:MAG: VTC domain-containing protein, partial [Lachnospiraceae bacterium]|nr:VTC domain-containing protein [Lachnospiraceae bacterium]
IRSYLSDMDERFHLEIKYRNRDKIRKESCELTPEEVQKILRGEAVDGAYDSGRAVLSQFEFARERMLLGPAVIVEYDRVPYVYPAGNVRITMDRNICASPDTGEFMQKDIVAVPVLERGFHLLEVKYDEYLPDFLRQALQIVSLHKISFSKYYLCRMAGKPLRMSEREQGQPYEF